jgi:hypothetical protein
MFQLRFRCCYLLVRLWRILLTLLACMPGTSVRILSSGEENVGAVASDTVNMTGATAA